MEQVRIAGEDRKEALKARARDRVYKFILGGGAVRGALINAPRMITEMRASHQLGILETYVLGQAYLAAALTAAELKSANRACRSVAAVPSKAGASMPMPWGRCAVTSTGFRFLSMSPWSDLTWRRFTGPVCYP